MAGSRLILTGTAASPGVATGRVHLLDRGRLTVPQRRIEGSAVEDELRRVERALHESQQQLSEIRDRLRGQEPSDHVQILDAHALMLRDQALFDEVAALIREHEINAEWAVERTRLRVRALFEKAEDLYLRERQSDVDFVTDRILRNLVGASTGVGQVAPDAVVVARDLSPADTLALSRYQVRAFATDVGGPTSHTAITARALSIPAVVGLGGISELVAQGDPIAVDGGRGEVIAYPNADDTARLDSERRRLVLRDRELLKERDLPAQTTDGLRVAMLANIEVIDEVAPALEHGAEGVGLFRSEFFFGDRGRPPDEQEQYRLLRRLLKDMDGRPVVVRTLDAGADKPCNGVPVIHQTNPALGLRGVRLSLRQRELFVPQLRALLRASVHGPLKILFPMISGLREVREVKRVLQGVMADLARERVQFDADVPLGIMIELPSAALVADRLAPEVDFFSIGTNDLIQHTLAVDRVNPDVAYLYRPLHLAVLRLLRGVFEAGKAHRVPVSMCGEMAGNPAFTALLLGLGLRSFSMASASIPLVKRVVRQVDREGCRKLADAALACTTSAEVEQLLTERGGSRLADL